LNATKNYSAVCFQQILGDGLQPFASLTLI
jgi:hypothetical protein